MARRRRLVVEPPEPAIRTKDGKHVLVRVAALRIFGDARGERAWVSAALPQFVDRRTVTRDHDSVRASEPFDSRAVLSLLRERFPATSLVRSKALSDRLGLDVVLKLELELPTGSFKVRGAFYALSKRRER